MNSSEPTNCFDFDKIYHRSRITLVNRKTCVDFSLELSKLISSSLIEWQELEPQAKSTDSLGRGGTKKVVLENGLAMVYRRYYRGGWVAKFVNQTFIGNPWGNSEKFRPIKELLDLAYLKQSEVRVPVPVAATVELLCGGMFYRGALATMEIPAAINLLEILLCNQPEKRNSFSNEDLERICYDAGCQVSLMLKAGKAHSDLHLGNIIVSQKENKVYLIDFDKAVDLDSSTQIRLWQKRIIARWQKSTEKHGLSALLIKSFSEGVMANCQGQG